MISIITRWVLFVPIALIPVSAAQDTPRTEPVGPREDVLPEAVPAITAREIEHHVRFLAADEMRGRSVATADSVRAARYLARAFERTGLAPAGDDGTFLQGVPFYRTHYEAVPDLLVQDAAGKVIPTQAGVDFTVRVRGAPLSTGELSVRVVRSLEELPREPDPKVALVLVARAGKAKAWLEERGAERGKGWGLIVRLGSETPGKPLGKPRDAFGMITAPLTDEPEEVTVRGALRKALDAGQVARLALDLHGARDEIIDYNVVGRIDGVGTPENPELAEEVIVLSAHYDHVGARPSRVAGEPDVVYNGADDDASGVATVLELAGAFAHLAEHGPAPARTLVFLLATGEERGILGTKYYVEHPAFPLERTVCNLNFEMLGRPDPLAGGSGKLWLTGFERSTLGPAFAERGIDVVADPRLDQNFFMRSDNIVFVQKGIVGQTLSTYNLHKDYHQPTDDADTLDYAHMEACAQAGFLAARLLADGDIRPEWNEGEPPVGRRR